MEDRNLYNEFNKIKHQARLPIFDTQRARQIYMKSELLESLKECKSEMDYIRCKIMSEQILDLNDK